jgi:hypothetical protein
VAQPLVLRDRPSHRCFDFCPERIIFLTRSLNCFVRQNNKNNKYCYSHRVETLDTLYTPYFVITQSEPQCNFVQSPALCCAYTTHPNPSSRRTSHLRAPILLYRPNETQPTLLLQPPTPEPKAVPIPSTHSYSNSHWDSLRVHSAVQI